MDNKSLIMLEYPQVIDALASYAEFSLSERLARSLLPFAERKLLIELVIAGA